MTLVSYAQNFEDVLLWRCFQGQERGFYIDVGAAHPDVDSVTRSFYDRGWSGINVEPAADLILRLRAARPRDINLDVALSQHAGTRRFYLIEGTGLSTLQPDLISTYSQSGFAVKETIVEVSTLAEVCRVHAPTSIDFLKIDVEGAEHEVLQGADFEKFRPKVVLVEATAPMSTVEVHAVWETVLEKAGYLFVWFDGLNRFYLADEYVVAMRQHFRTPPNVFDNFLRASDTTWARLVADAEGRSASLNDRVVSMEKQSREEARAAAQVRALSEARRAEIAGLRDAILHLQGSASDQAALRQHADMQLEWLHRSTSWRVTAPLRLVSKALARVRTSAPKAIDPERTENAKIIHNQAADPPQALVDYRPQFPLPSVDRPLTTIHQFHSGSAVGDAITNAMLMTRTVLRNLGYFSDIFVEHRDPELADQLRLMSELPQHAHYILIIRHSMGFDGFAQILALPAKKILIYHNITPPEFLNGLPVLQEYSRLGRAQLRQLQGHVISALADSEFNAIELRQLGFPLVQSCSLLVDVDGLRREGAMRRQNAKSQSHDRPFTILFVGRLIEAKGQRELIAAFCVFVSAFEGPARLVLVGRTDGAGSEYSAEIAKVVRDAGLESQVVMTGLISDDERNDMYCEADLYVSLSQHEGFGIPLLEAMAYGVPVLAWPAAAVPYTLGGASQTLSSREAPVVAASILELARSATRRAQIVDDQYRNLDRFDLRAETAKLTNALVAAGAAFPRDAIAKPILSDCASFTIVGHINKTYSLAAINRMIAAAIEAEHPGRVRIVPVETRPTNDLSEVPSGELEEVRTLVGRQREETGPRFVISHHYPVYVPDDGGDCLTCLFFWEESVVPSDVVDTLNRSFAGVLAPTEFVAKTLIDSGVVLPVRVLGCPPQRAAQGSVRKHRKSPRPPNHKFTLLHISSCFPRKGVDILLKAFAKAFSADDKVRLLIKGFPNPHNDVAEQIAALRALYPSSAEIEFVNQDLTSEELSAIYAQADILVLPTRGEGLNLIAYEALEAGIPVIVTGFGGHMDFCNASNTRLLDYSFATSASHLATPHSIWAEPDEKDLMAAMREAFDGSCPSPLPPQLSGRFVPRLIDASVDILLSQPAPPLRVAWISTWDVRCGIAEYSRNLVDNFPASPFIESILVMCDERTVPMTTETHKVSAYPTWRVAKQETVETLSKTIFSYDPHVIVIQHQPGLMPWPMLTALLASRALSDRTTVITLHNTRHLLDIDDSERVEVLSALAMTRRVVVHTIADLNRLKTLGLVNNVTMMPHGAEQRLPDAQPRSAGMPGSPIIGCYGFFLPGKGIRELIGAAAVLRRTWPRLKLRLVNAAYDSPESHSEIESCRQAAEALGMTDAIEWITEFLPTHASLQLLAECNVVVLPYRESKEASSAALRTALGAGRPIAVTPIQLFEEANNAVFRLPGSGSEEIAAGIESLLNDADRLVALQHAAQRWLQEHAWAGIAKRFQGMLRGLAENEPA